MAEPRRGSRLTPFCCIVPASNVGTNTSVKSSSRLKATRLDERLGVAARLQYLILVGVILTFTVAIPGYSQELAQEPKLKIQLQKKLDEIIAEEGFPGATLAVMLKDGTMIDLASGYEDQDTQEKLEIGSRMFSGSTGKTYASAVALQLIDEGKFQLDDLAEKYFETEKERTWFSRLPNASSITIRSLMNHTSGLPRYIFQEAFLDELKREPMKNRNPTESLSVLFGVDPIHEVGKGWGYSDSDYLVLGLIIEKVTGQNYFDFAQSRILDPLHLDDTLATKGPELEGLTQGHIGSSNPFSLPEKTVKGGRYVLNPNFEWCGGGYVSNASDLAKWIHALHSGEVISEKMHALLVSPVDFRTGQPAEQGYGLGTFVWKTENGLFFGHAGMMPGYLTQMEFSRDHQFAIAFQTNTDESMGRRLHQHVQAIAEMVIAQSK